MPRLQTTPIAILLSLFCITLTTGCASGPMTQLTFEGGDAPAVYEYRDVYWRPLTQDANGIEFVGYGFAAFYNDPVSRHYDPRWPRMGRVVIRLHGQSRPDGQFDFTLLGPAMLLGPGDNEMITGAGMNVQIASDEKDMKRITIPPTSAKSFNYPDLAARLSGTIIAQRADDSTFDRQLKQFNTEKGYRDLPRAVPPPGR